MTPKQLAKIRRRTAREVVLSALHGPNIEILIERAVEAAMNEEWWRGYYAGRGVAHSPSPLPLGYETSDLQVEARYGPEERPDWSQIVKS